MHEERRAVHVGNLGRSEVLKYARAARPSRCTLRSSSRRHGVEERRRNVLVARRGAPRREGAQLCPARFKGTRGVHGFFQNPTQTVHSGVFAVCRATALLRPREELRGRHPVLVSHLRPPPALSPPPTRTAPPERSRPKAAGAGGANPVRKAAVCEHVWVGDRRG